MSTLIPSLETQSLISKNVTINDIQAHNAPYLCDILLILIATVDVMTDFSFPVLFYLNGYQQLFSFFVIIMIVTQITYAATMILRLQTATNNNKSILYWTFVFILLLLFGHIFSFIVYFTEYHQQSWTVKLFQRTKLHYLIKQNYQQMLNDADSHSVWCTRNKLQHILYLTEAIIASLPHTALQIAGIHSYQISNKYNNIPIILILLAILSIIFKSYLLSPGIDSKTRIWTLLCILADLFFIVSILCPTNTFPDYSFIVLIFSRLTITVSIVLFIVMAVMIIELMEVITTSADRYFENKYVKRIWICLLVFLSSFYGVIIFFALCFFFTMFFYVFIALLIYYGSTMRWKDYTNPNVNAQINSMINFIANINQHSKNDRIIRIVIAHYYAGYGWDAYYKTSIPQKYTFKTPKRNEEIRYKHIRNESAKYPKIANLYPAFYDLFRYLIADITGSKFERCVLWFLFIVCLLGAVAFILSLPFPAIVPYIMVCSLIRGQAINLFELAFLLSSFGFQLLLLLLGISVFKTHWWLWHIRCGEMNIDLNHHKKTLCLSTTQQIESWYNELFYPGQVDEIILKEFGNDIGCIILGYIWPNNDVVLQMVNNGDNVEQLKGKEITYDSDSECKDVIRRHIKHGNIMSVDATSKKMIIKDIQTGAYGCYDLNRISGKYKNPFCDF